MASNISINGFCVVSRKPDSSGLKPSRIIMEIRFSHGVSSEKIDIIRNQLPSCFSTNVCDSGVSVPALYLSLASEDSFGKIISFLSQI